MEENSFGKNLRKFRNAANLTQAQLADLVGVSLLTFFRWEKGETRDITKRVFPLSLILGSGRLSAISNEV